MEGISRTAASEGKEHLTSYRNRQTDFQVARTLGCNMVNRQWQDCRRGLKGLGKACFLEEELNTEARARSVNVQACQGAEAGPEMRSEINLAS